MNSSARLSSLPLFPLGTVLYPGGSLPLRIFEVRYLDMITRCHKAGAPFGVVALTSGHEVRRPGVAETFATIGTIATIDTLDSPQPGLLTIRCSGAQRFRIVSSSQLKHGLWIADVERIGADAKVTVPDDLQSSSVALGQLIDSLKARQVQPEAMPIMPPYELADCGWVANRWCELLPMPLELKQRLLELDNPLVRLELIGDLLDRQGITRPPAAAN